MKSNENRVQWVFTFLVTVKKIYDDEEVRLVLADYGGKCLWVR